MTYPNGTKVSVRNTPNVENGEEGVVVGYSHADHLLKVDFGGKVVFCCAENCSGIKGMTKDEKIKEVMELVDSYAQGVASFGHPKWDKRRRKSIESKLRELIQ